MIEVVRYRIDIKSLRRTPASSLRQNEIGRVRLRTTAPLFVDPYRKNRGTGSFLLIDEAENNTVAAGIVLDRAD